MERNDYLEHCKERALREDDMYCMWASFHNDMSKHDELKDHIALNLGMSLLAMGSWKTKQDCEKFINGFN